MGDKGLVGGKGGLGISSSSCGGGAGEGSLCITQESKVCSQEDMDSLAEDGFRFFQDMGVPVSAIVSVSNKRAVCLSLYIMMLDPQGLNTCKCAVHQKQEIAVLVVRLDTIQLPGHGGSILQPFLRVETRFS
jgi:hypothetical protein